jgi:hypothetical protein
VQSKLCVLLIFTMLIFLFNVHGILVSYLLLVVTVYSMNVFGLHISALYPLHRNLLPLNFFASVSQQTIPV